MINNVGIGGDGPANRADEASFERIMETNVTGMWLITTAALSHVREQGQGLIVNISSLAAVAGGIELPMRCQKPRTGSQLRSSLQMLPTASAATPY